LGGRGEAGPAAAVKAAVRGFSGSGTPPAAGNNIDTNNTNTNNNNNNNN
jgi:hypothetical protein